MAKYDRTERPVITEDLKQWRMLSGKGNYLVIITPLLFMTGKDENQNIS